MFPKCFPISHGCQLSSVTAKAVIAGAALAASLAFISSANASMLVSVVLGWGPGNMVIPANGTVAAAPSAGSNEWNGFGADNAVPYNITFNPVNSNGNATSITGTFVETNPSYQFPWYDSASGILPPFVDFPAATWGGTSGADASSPSNPIGPDTLTLTGLNPASGYDVYIYSAYTQGVSSGGNTPTVSLNLTKGTTATTSYTYAYTMSDPNLLASYQLGTNYEEFQNVTPDSTGTIAIAGTGVNTSLFNAFQLYSASPVPDPATLGLFAIGGLVLIGRKRAARRNA